MLWEWAMTRMHNTRTTRLKAGGSFLPRWAAMRGTGVPNSPKMTIPLTIDILEGRLVCMQCQQYTISMQYGWSHWNMQKSSEYCCGFSLQAYKKAMWLLSKTCPKWTKDDTPSVLTFAKLNKPCMRAEQSPNYDAHNGLLANGTEYGMKCLTVDNITNAGHGLGSGMNRQSEVSEAFAVLDIIQQALNYIWYR